MSDFGERNTGWLYVVGKKVLVAFLINLILLENLKDILCHFSFVYHRSQFYKNGAMWAL